MMAGPTVANDVVVSGLIWGVYLIVFFFFFCPAMAG